MQTMSQVQENAVLSFTKCLFLSPRLQHMGTHSQQEKKGDSYRLETSSAKSMMDIGTRQIFSEEHDLFRKSVRRFFEEEVMPHHKE